jgi:hypothetical protein
VTPREVKDAARALAAIDEPTFRDLYDRVVPRDYAPEYGPEDRDYTWAYLEEVRAFYERAAEAGRAVVFVVDQ